MSIWARIDNRKNSYRLLCSNDNCSLSLCNLIDGMLSITTIHGNQRHSYQFTHEDMLFLVSQYLNSLSEKDRKNILEFFRSF